MKKILSITGLLIASVYLLPAENIAAAIGSNSQETRAVKDSADAPVSVKIENPAVTEDLLVVQKAPVTKGVTIEDIDRVMAELVSKLPPEQRATIRKSNGETYEYMPPLQLNSSKKIKNRKIIEIRNVDSNSLRNSALTQGDIPTQHIRLYQNGQDSGQDELLSYVLSESYGGEDSHRDINNYNPSSNFLDHFSIAVGASTTGFRLDYGATISRNMDFRLGFSYLNFSPGITVGTQDEQIRDAAGGYDPDLDFDADMEFYNLHALFDFYPMRNGIFHLTAGLFFGKNTISVNGSLIDPQTGENSVLQAGYDAWPNLHFADYEIPVTPEGTIRADIRTGKNWIKPYLGLGLGRSVPKGNFSFKLEAGLMYQGSYSIEYGGTEFKKAKGRSDSFDSHYKDLMKWWPVVNFQLVYRFK